MGGYLKSVWGWLAVPQVELLIGVAISALLSIALAGQISWLWLILAVVVLVFLPPALGGGWVRRFSSRWSREAFGGAVVTAMLAFAVIRVEASGVRALLAVVMAYVAYLAGRYSN